MSRLVVWLGVVWLGVVWRPVVWRRAACLLVGWLLVLWCSVGTALASDAPPREVDSPDKAESSPEAVRSKPVAPGDSKQKQAEAQRPAVRPDQARSWERRPSTAPEDIYLAVPRALLFVPKLALQLVYMPIEGLAVLTDRYHLVEHTIDLLYNDARTAAIIPLASFQAGQGLTLGAKVFHNDLIGNGEELAFSARYGGLFSQAYQLSFEGERVGHTPLWVESFSRFEAKPGLLFYGIGDRSLTSEPDVIDAGGLDAREIGVETRFRQKRIMLANTVGAMLDRPGRLIAAGIRTIYNYRRFGSDVSSHPEPSVEQVFDTSTIAGFDEGATVLELSPAFVFDSRDSRGQPSTGNYVDLFGGGALPLGGANGFWHYGATVATYIELFLRRTLSLRLVHEAVAGPSREIPFSELIKLGGPRTLRGYNLDRFRDKIGTVASVEYRYPIHQRFSGEVFLDAGRVGKNYAETFSRSGLSSLHYGGGLGFVMHSEEKTIFKAQLAYGEELVFFFTTDPLEAFSERHKRL